MTPSRGERRTTRSSGKGATTSWTGKPGLLPGRGDDVYGGSGDDVVFGSDTGATNLLDGGPGNDFIQGFGPSDTAYGRSGTDEVYGFFGDDFLSGGEGSDLVGKADDFGDDVMEGDQGEDALDGGPGFDTLDGGAQEDVCINGEESEVPLDRRLVSEREEGPIRRALFLVAGTDRASSRVGTVRGLEHVRPFLALVSEGGFEPHPPESDSARLVSS
jgi:Ca2+-binding RTX toxin-like protein